MTQRTEPQKQKQKPDFTNSKFKKGVKTEPPKQNSDLTNSKFKDGVKTEPQKQKQKPDLTNSKFKEGVNRNARLIVRNVSFKATEESLREHFAPYGTVEEVKLLRRPDGKLVGCGFVHFTHVPMAQSAMTATNRKPFLGRPISVDWAVVKHKYMKHVVEQQLQLQEDVKKEDSDSDDDEAPLNISTDVKAEVKSESEDDSDDVKSEDDDESGSDDGTDSDENDDEEDIDMEENEDDNQSVTPEKQRIKLNDAEDGRTVFVSNIPFSVTSEQLRQYAESKALVVYALVCTDKLTEHSRGTGFIKFVTNEDADNFMALPAEELTLEGQTLKVQPALKRENLKPGDKKQPKDNRNLYLVKEGVVVAGTKAAVGVSASDMAKRLALERSKTQMLKNLNRFVSRYRIVVSNLPPSCDDARLRAYCSRAVPRAVITEARVMRDLRGAVNKDGTHTSKGYGFVMFNKHEDALMCLRKLNNNPDIFDKNNRPIVSFSIEDRTALNARKKRLEKSIANNPQNKPVSEDNENPNQKAYRKRKNMERPDESTMKKGRFDRRNNNNQNGDWKQNKGDWQQNKGGGQQNKGDWKQNKGGGQQIKGDFKQIKGDWKQNKGGRNKFGNKNNQAGQFVRPQQNEVGDYAGLTAKEGTQHKMRSNHKLKMQASVHRETVKAEKKLSKHAQRLKMATKERVKQPKQKINKNSKKGQNNITEKKVHAAIKESANFTDLVSKYKSKLSGNSLNRVKAKWYEN